MIRERYDTESTALQRACDLSIERSVASGEYEAVHVIASRGHYYVETEDQPGDLFVRTWEDLRATFTAGHKETYL